MSSAQSFELPDEPASWEPELIQTSAFSPEGQQASDLAGQEISGRAISAEQQREIVGFRLQSKPLLFEKIWLEEQGSPVPAELEKRYERFVELAEVARRKTFQLDTEI